jgi:basic amino acid/polyamine antiporter, APA family
VNSVLGSGIFGLPSVVAALVGRASLLAVPLAGAAIAVIMACYAEVASQFTQTGGTYLYARVAFGRFAGIQVGWFWLLVRITAAAANANLLVVYLGEFWPRATSPVPRLLILTALVGILAAVNYRGVRAATQVSNVFVAAKLIPLALVCVVGAIYLITTHRVVPPATPPADAHTWLKAMLVLFFAYGGAESALTPTGEAKNPRRDLAFALFVALLIITIIYSVIQWVVLGVLPDAAHTARPLAGVGTVLMGRAGAVFISLGALVSIYGYLSAQMLTGPRGTFALGEGDDFPRWFAAIHPKFRTPNISIIVFASQVWVLALFGSFTWNVTLSAVARLLYYALMCLAVPVLRRKQPDASAFRLPGGLLFPTVGVAICLVLAAGVDLSESLILAATFAVAAINWVVVRRAMNGAAIAP